MGMFDTVFFEGIEYQTKALGSTLAYYQKGDKVSLACYNDGFSTALQKAKQPLVGPRALASRDTFQVYCYSGGEDCDRLITVYQNKIIGITDKRDGFLPLYSSVGTLLEPGIAAIRSAVSGLD